MSLIVYDEDKLQQASDDVVTLQAKVNDMKGGVDTFLGSIDLRIKDYFDFVGSLETNSSDLDNDSSNCDGFQDWYSLTYDDYINTKTDTEDDSESIEDPDIDDETDPIDPSTEDTEDAVNEKIDDDVENPDVGGQGSTDPTEVVYPDTDEIPDSVKEALVAKLVEVGYPEEEAEKIVNGEVPVNKLELENLSTELEELYKTNPSIRQLIIDKYNVDVFNDDGTVNKDLLAILMQIDSKNPSDGYDLTALINSLKNSGIDGSVPTADLTTLEPTQVNPSDYSGVDSSSHTGGGTDGLLLDGLNGVDKNNSNSDLSDSLIDSILGNSKHGSVLPSTDEVVKTSSSMAIPLAASLGAAAATAGGVGLFVNKPKEDDDDDDFEDDKSDIEKAIDDVKHDSGEADKDKGDKSWLLGLGIGLAGAAAVAEEEKKRREKQEDNNEEDDIESLFDDNN